MSRRRRPRHLIIAFALLGAVGLAATGAFWLSRRPAPSRVRLEQAKIALAKGASSQALSFAAAVRAREPDNRAAMWIQGKAQLRLGELDDARATAEAMIESDPQQADGRRLLVQWAFARMNETLSADDDSALAAFDEAEALCRQQAAWLANGDRTEAEGRLIRACCAESRSRRLIGDTEAVAAARAEARVEAESARAADPRLWAAWDLTYRLLSPTEGAEALWSAAETLSAATDIPAAIAQQYVAAVLAIDDQAHPAAARVELCSALVNAIAPEQTDGRSATLAASAVMMAGGRLVEAESALTALLQRKPRDIDARRLMAKCLLRLGRSNQAAPILARLSNALPRDAEVHALHALALMDTGETDDAEAAARLAMTTDPNAVLPYLLLADLRTRRGDAASARMHMLTLARRRPADPDTFARLSRFYLATNAVDEGVDAMIALRALNPVHARLGEAWLHLHVDHLDAGRDCLADALAGAIERRDDAAISTADLLASVYTEQGDLNAARSVYDGLIAADFHADAARIRQAKLPSALIR